MQPIFFQYEIRFTNVFFQRHLLKTNEINQRLSRMSPNVGEFYDHNQNINLVQESPNSSSASTSGPSRAFSKLEEKLKSLIGVTSTRLTERNIKQKLENLCYNDRVTFDTNVLDYWKGIYNKDPDLGRLAEVALAVPATQVSVERAFSALSTILTKMRSKLSKETINNILIVKLNDDILNKLCIDI